jgi:hypothetical protein
MTNRPILCGKCGTSSDAARPIVTTTRRYSGNDDDLNEVEVECLGCGRVVSSDSLPAALAKFEEKVSDDR